MKLYWTLLKTVLINDVRQQFYHPEKKNYSNSLNQIVFPVLLSLTISLSLFQTSEVYYYAFFILTFSMLITTFTFLVEFSTRIIKPEDLEIWISKPVPSKSLFFVKLGQVIITIVMVSCLTTVIPSILISFALSANAWFGLQLWLTALFANTILAFLIMIIYIGIGLLSTYQKSKQILIIFQLIIAFFLIGLHQWGVRISQETSWADFLTAHPFLKALPSVWFNTLLGCFSGLWAQNPGLMPLYFLLAFFILTGISIGVLPKLYFKLLQAQPAETAVKPPIRRFIEKPIESKYLSSAFKGGIWLIWHLIKRDRSVLIPLLPPLTFPLIIIFFQLYDGQSILFMNESENSFQVSFFPLIITSIFFTVYLLHNSLQYAKNHKAFWIIHLSLKHDAEKFNRGIRLGIFGILMTPVLILLSLLYAIILPFPFNISHALILYVLTFFSIPYFNLLYPLLPFSQPRQSRKNSLPQMIISFIPLLVFEYLFYTLVHTSKTHILHYLILMTLLGISMEFGGSLRIRKKMLQQMRGLHA